MKIKDYYDYETIEVRKKKRNWYLIGIFMGCLLGLLLSEVIL